MKQWYYRFANGSLTRISNLPKVKDGYDYIELSLEDGAPVKSRVLAEKDFEGYVEPKKKSKEKKDDAAPVE